MSTRPTTQAYRVCTASRTASHFRFCQPLSGLFGPVKIAFYTMTTGSSSVAGDLYTDSQSLPPIAVGQVRTS